MLFRTLPRLLLSLTVCTLLISLSEATVAQEKKEEAKGSSPEAVAAYADAANAQNNGAFELAVEEWEKFVAKHGKDPLATKAQHYLGVCRLQLKQFDKAAAAFEAVLKAAPEFEFAEDAMLNLAWSQYSQASPAKAELYTQSMASFEALLKKFAKGKYADQALFFQGECLYNTGKKKEAVPFYDKVVKGYEKSSLRCDAIYALGTTLEELGEFAEAGKAYDLFLPSCTTSPLVTEVRMRKAETMLQADSIAEAEKIFAEVAAVAGFAAADQALSRQGLCLSKQKKFLEAAAVYAKIPASFPQSPLVADANLSAARAYYQGEKFDEAATWFQKVVDANGTGAPEAAHWICRVHLRNKKPDLALALADKILSAAAQGPFLVSLKMDRADALYELPEKRPDSLAAYLKIATEHPQDAAAPQALYNAAFGAMEAKQHEEGAKQAASFLAQYKQDRLLPDVKYVQAECLLQLGKQAEAEAGYRDLIATHAAHADSEIWRVRLGLVLYLQKKYADVVTTITPQIATLKSADNVAEAQFVVGASLFNQDKFAEATQALNASLAANAKWRQSDEALLLLSRCQRKANQINEALATVKKMVAEFPASKLLDQAHYRLGEFSYAANDFATSTAEYELVATKFPDSTFAPYALYGKGWSLLKNKQYAPAADSFTALLTKAPQHTLAADTQFARAMCRRQAGDHAGAVADVEAFLKTNPSPEHKADALYERGLAEVALKNNAAAAATFAALLKENEKYAAADKVLYELAWAWKSQEKNEDALPHFMKLAATFPDSPLAPEANFHVGEAQYEKKQYEESIKSYTAAKQKAGTGEIAEKAAYKLGWSHFQLKQYQPALNEFTAQLAASPQGALATDGLFMKAECLFRMDNFKDALPAFTAASQASMLPAKLEVLILLHGGQSASQLKQWADSVKFLQTIPQKFADSPYLPEAHYELGWAKQNQAQLDEALKDYEIAATKSRDQVGARARFMTGEIFFEKKNYDEAVKQFQRVVFGYGGDNSAAEVKTWQAQASFEAARCWEVQIQGAPDAKRKSQCITEAKKHYSYVVQKHATTKYATDAKQRLEALSKL